MKSKNHQRTAHRHQLLATHRPIVPLLQLLQMRRLRPRGRRQLAEALQRTLSGVFARVVDVLPVVPEAGVDGLRADGHGAGPRGAAAWEQPKWFC